MTTNTDTSNANDTAGGLMGGGDDGAGAESKDVNVQTSGQESKGGLTGGDDKSAAKGDAKGDKAATDKAAADKLVADKAKAGDVDVKFGALQVDEKLVGKFKATAKELGLDSAKAQKVADLYVEVQKHEEAQVAAALEKQDAGWIEAMKADKELGGVDFNKNVMHARKALGKFGTPELTKIINGYGLANNPELTRVFARIGKAIAEDSIAGGADAGSVSKNDAEARQRKAYPKMYARLDREKAD